MGLPLALLVALCLTLTWAGGSELRRAGRTRNHGQSVCSTWGNSHYKTFDGDVFRFPGLCDYNFASDCRDTYQEFAVHLKRAPGHSGGHPQVKYILLTVKGDAIYLTSQLAVVNGAVVSSPHYSPGLLIEQNDAYTKVYSRAGLMLMWNREDSVMLELDSKFRNHTCGLCGDYNGLQTYSEFLSDGEGVLFSPVEFGNMQKVNKPEEVCEGPQEVPTPASCSEHRAECERLLTNTVFEDCRNLVPLELYVQACVQDRCQCPHGTSCVCSTIAEFSRQCSHAGGRPRNWRTASLCPKSCPRTMVYLESGSPCMDTCSHLEVSSLCEEHRMDGCFCPEGTVYDDIKGDGCIPVNQCHCKLHGHLYAPGQQITNSCEQCVCNAGRWVCQDLQCPGTCALEGGAHITTFDERKYTFHGDCYYVLTKDTHDSYAVLGELTPCGSTDKQTCLKTVVLLADNKKNVVAFKLDGSVLLNELKVNLPHVTASFSILQPSSYHIVVTTAFGLRLQVQLVPVMQLFLTLDHAAQGLVQGLCGNFNGLEGDDFRTPGGLVEATGAGFANSWKAQSSCRNKLDWLDDPCSLSIESANYAEHWCSLLKKTESPFSKCHSAVDPAEYYKRCKYDTCNCQSMEDCMCAALSSYARACTIKGVTLWGWRERVCNKDVGSCPRSQVFLYNLTTCQPTCRSLSEPDTHCVKGFAPVDGCGCPDHTFLDEKGRCVVLAKCSCYHDGLYLEAGKTILRQEKRCVCQNGRLHCLQVKQPYQRCPAPKIHVDCNNRTALATRNPRPVSCQTLAAGYYQMECSSGCVCPEGLIDDGRGGCVVEEACPCVHNKDLYSPGDKIRVDCNTCTCQKGRWACTQSVCHGTCAIYGNSHYITFDGKYYDFDGRCSYVAVQDYCGQNSSLGSFSVITENVPCGTTGVTCSKAIKIFLGRTELKLEDKHCMVIQRDVGHHVAYTTREVGQYLVVEASVGILVIWDKRTSVFIKLAPSYKGTVCGLCGNFDQRSSNDFTTRDHMVVESELDFGNSWKEAPTCPDVSATPEPCVLRPHRRSWAEKQCSIIKGPVFGVCHSKVDPKPFYEACVHDSCSCDTGGDCECFCSAVAAYAQECTKEGACVFWRTPELCRCYPRCPKDSPLYDEDLKKCVTRDQCGCYVNGTHYAPGEPVPTEQICHSCVCDNSSQVVCWPEVGKNVTSKKDSPFCYWETCGPNGTVEEHFSICEPTPPPSSPSTPATTTSVSLITPSTTTSTTLTASTALRLARLGLCCSWSDWINDDHPRIGSDGGDRETFNHVCRAPKDIECRVAISPNLRWEELGQEAQCNTPIPTTTETTTATLTTTSTATPTPTPTTTATETPTPTTTETPTTTPTTTSTGTPTATPSTTTTETPTPTTTVSTTSSTSKSLPTSSPPTSQSTYPSSMESTTLVTTAPTTVETYSTPQTPASTESAITTTGGTTPSPSTPGPTPPGSPTSAPTSSKTAPTHGTTTGPPSSTTGPPSTPTPTPATVSTTSTGASTPIGHSSTMPPTPQTTSTLTSSVTTPTVIPLTSPHITTSIVSVTTGTQRECCYLNDTYYAPGELVYNSTHGDTCYYVNCSLDCTLEIFNWSCPSTPTTQPSMTSSVPPTTKPPACLDFDPPRQENETWWLCNCTMAICKYNNTVELVEVKCDPPPMPTCSNGLMPVRVEDPDKCCWHWECDCYCTGWGDPHYVTFDGLYYSYKGNCTYVLVEEITPTMGNFGVYIDNQHCDTDSQVSCPRTLIVRHETQEVLIKTVHTMPMRVQVQVNRQAVALPYRKYGLQVYQSGINYVVDIPELGALISYDSLSFSIRLPYHRFGNNTKGQCGTCTNSTSDDCMLPGGEAVASCEVAAGHWVVNDPSEPQCPHRGFTTKRPAAWPSVGSSTTTGTRPPSPLCELIKDSLFAPCHAVASPRHYYEGCTSDSFAAPGSGLECASLQTYAALCAQKGICVDWRSRTGGACPVTCPAHREYRACGPVEEPTCRSSPTQANSPRLAEGCFCPKGTTSYAPGFDVCVDLCGCVGPDNVPREFGEHFEFDCKDCICLEGGSGIICRPKTCHPRPRVECKEKGTYTVTEVDPANVCCNITSCKCNTSLCRENPPPCPLGFEVKSKMVPGRCCPFYSCVPKGVCVLRNAEYQPGSPVFSSKCQNCTCTDRRDNATQLNVISCTHVPCNTSCNRGFELVDVPGECCKKCQQTQCIVINQPGSQSVVLKPGDMKRDPLNNCTFFSCMKIHDQFISSVSSITCPDFDPSTCLPGSITLMPNGCCRKCLPRNETRVPCSTVPVVREISHNGCTKLVTMNDCSGSCGTFAMYSAEAQSLDHRCSCCKEQRTSQREVTLQCPDGRGLNHTYTHIDSCLCQDTMCELPPWRRARRSGLRDLGPGRG
ncbi:mucin-2 [Tursiops truncatus]|uniref:Mucin-2 n=1 Tax=Tursiops truncatus TaxID=9739 RepID=A0A6J3RRN1_TURTR|nr:mucin-2 [Tursiops truncatus]